MTTKCVVTRAAPGQEHFSIALLPNDKESLDSASERRDRVLLVTELEGWSLGSSKYSTVDTYLYCTTWDTQRAEHGIWQMIERMVLVQVQVEGNVLLCTLAREYLPPISFWRQPSGHASFFPDILYIYLFFDYYVPTFQQTEIRSTVRSHERKNS